MADNFVLSPNMNMPIPIVGIDPGPDYADNQNASLLIVDTHDHSPGKGVQITPDGISINEDLPFGSNNATGLRSVRFTAQVSPLALATDLACAYVSGVDLYYNDGNGNQVRITQSGGVAGSPGSISNLTSPASASYVAADGTFVWESDASTPANMDCASVIVREFVANGKGITFSAPAGLASDYTLTWPGALPASTKLLTVDTSGNVGDAWAFDGTTIEVSANTVQVKDHGISQVKLGTLGQSLSSSSGAYTRASVTFADVTNLSVSVTTSGRPLIARLIADGSTSVAAAAYVGVAGAIGESGYLKLLRDAVVVGIVRIKHPSADDFMAIPPGSVDWFDAPVAGTYTYKVQASTSSAGLTILVNQCKLVVYQE